jgi:hypothetical protein
MPIRPSVLLPILLSIAGPGLASAGAVAAPPTPADAGQTAPRTLRFSPEVLDLGEFTAGTPKSGTLTVTNAGDRPVRIESVKAGCGCTKVSDPPKDPVAPGASFTLELTLDPGKKTGVELVKNVHVVLEGGTVESMQIKGRVKTAIEVEPAIVDLTEGNGRDAAITLESVDGADFTVTGVVPEGTVDLATPTSAVGRLSLGLDLAAWERAGKPSTIVLATDRADQPEVHVPIQASENVALFRLPAAAALDPRRPEIESEQDSLIRSIDAGMASSTRSSGFRMRLHRESGMLFVHGTAADLDAVRASVGGLPASSGVRESRNVPPA